MNSYSILDQYGGWIIRKTEPTGRNLYLQKTYGGIQTWVRDYTYAKKHSYKTAVNHLRSIRRNDPNCEEDF